MNECAPASYNATVPGPPQQKCTSDVDKIHPVQLKILVATKLQNKSLLIGIFIVNKPTELNKTRYSQCYILENHKQTLSYNNACSLNAKFRLRILSSTDNCNTAEDQAGKSEGNEILRDFLFHTEDFELHSWAVENCLSLRLIRF